MLYRTCGHCASGCLRTVGAQLDFLAQRTAPAAQGMAAPIEVTKHSWHGNYFRLIEISGGSLMTRNPDGGALTNEWRVSDITDVTQEARGMRLRLHLARKCCGMIPNSLCVSLPTPMDAAALFRLIVAEMAREPSCQLLRRALLEKQKLISGRGDSFQRRRQEAAAAAPGPSTAPTAAAPPPPPAEAIPSDEEKRAAIALMKVSDGALCLACVRADGTPAGNGGCPSDEGGSGHVWRAYDGQRGSGRGCELCLMCMDLSSRITWRISPSLPPSPSVPPPVAGRASAAAAAAAAASATRLLALWRTELARVTSSSGCIAGGEHVWMDASSTELRLTGPGLCCKRCGLVCDAATAAPAAAAAPGPAPSAGMMVQGRRVIVLPNMLGQFGPAIRSLKAYRGEFKASSLVQSG